MTGPALTLLAYAVAVCMPLAVVAWPVLERTVHLPRGTAVLVAAAFWVGLVLPPAVGLAIDHGRVPGECRPGRECVDYILWWFAVPVGWLLAALVMVAAVAVGRSRHGHR